MKEEMRIIIKEQDLKYLLNDKVYNTDVYLTNKLDEKTLHLPDTEPFFRIE